MKTMLATTLLLAGAAGGCTMIESGSDDDTGGGGAVKMCKSARLLAGSTTFHQEPDRGLWNPAGQPAKADPPIDLFNLAGRGSQLLVSTGASVWSLDTAAPTPMFRRVFGDDTATPARYQPTGACASGRVMAGDGLAYLPDGRAVIGDAWGNGVIELSDPASASCQLKPIAGTQVAISQTDLMSGQIYEQGDIVGPGAQARFRRPDDATTDGAGNVFVFDDSNMSIKKIAPDAARTVTKLFDLPDDMNTVNSMAAIGGKLYAAGGMSGGDKIVEIDIASGSSRTVVSGAAFPEAAGGTGIPIAMTSDGHDLYVYLWKGYVYRVTTAGEVTLIAGKGHTETSTEARELDTSKDLDPATLPLEYPEMVHGANLHWNQGHLYVPARYDYAWALWDLTCD